MGCLSLNQHCGSMRHAPTGPEWPGKHQARLGFPEHCAGIKREKVLDKVLQLQALHLQLPLQRDYQVAQIEAGHLQQAEAPPTGR